MKTIGAFIVGLVLIPILFAFAGIAGWLPSKATSTPPKWEMAVGMRSLDASLERRAKGLKNPFATDRTALAAGAKLYQQQCSGCHGDTKGPSSWGSNDFYPRVPQFYQEGADVTPEEAYTAIHGGIRYSGMAAWGDQIADSDIWKLANFVSQIRRLPPDQLKAGRPH